MTNINENDFTELSFPSSIHEIGTHIADKKKWRSIHTTALQALHICCSYINIIIYEFVYVKMYFTRFII